MSSCSLPCRHSSFCPSWSSRIFGIECWKGLASKQSLGLRVRSAAPARAFQFSPSLATTPMSSQLPPTDDVERAMELQLGFYVSRKERQFAKWTRLFSTHSLADALSKAVDERAFEVAVFVQTESGGIMYWTSSEPDCFNSSAIDSYCEFFHVVRAAASMTSDNADSHCRVCGWRQPDPPWGPDGRSPSHAAKPPRAPTKLSSPQGDPTRPRLHHPHRRLCAERFSFLGNLTAQQRILARRPTRPHLARSK